MKKYVMEAVGSMFLLLVISLTGNPIAIGTVLVALVCMGGSISGGHYNPAISLGFWLQGKLSKKDFYSYVVYQLLGGLVAAMIYWVMIGERYFPAPGVGIALWKVFLLELVFTAFFVFVALSVWNAVQSKENCIHSGLAIGFAFLAISFLGGTYNPMVSISSTALDAIFFGASIKFMPFYALGSFGGGVVATYMYKYFYSA